VNVVLNGPLVSTFDNGDASPEVLIIADQGAYLNGNATVSEDVRVVGNLVSMVGAAWDVGTLDIDAGEVALGDGVSQGATIETETLLDVFALGQVSVNKGVLITSRAANSLITMDVGGIQVLGTISAGAEVDAGSIVKSGNGADIVIQATDLIRVMNGTALDGTSIGGAIEATDNVTLIGGLGISNNRFTGAGLWIESRGRVESANRNATGSSTVPPRLQARVHRGPHPDRQIPLVEESRWGECGYWCESNAPPTPTPPRRCGLQLAFLDTDERGRPNRPRLATGRDSREARRGS